MIRNMCVRPTSSVSEPTYVYDLPEVTSYSHATSNTANTTYNTIKAEFSSQNSLISTTSQSSLTLSYATTMHTDLNYYGYRYYSSDLGRWINRDSIEERGGVNLYSFNRNDALNRIDILGNIPCNSEIDVWDQGMATLGVLIEGKYAIYLNVWGASSSCCRFSKKGSTVARGLYTWSSGPVTQTAIAVRDSTGDGGSCASCCAEGRLECYTVTADYEFILGFQAGGIQIGVTLASGTLSITICADGTYSIDKENGSAFPPLGAAVSMTFNKGVNKEVKCPR